MNIGNLKYRIYLEETPKSVSIAHPTFVRTTVKGRFMPQLKTRSLIAKTDRL